MTKLSETLAPARQLEAAVRARSPAGMARTFAVHAGQFVAVALRLDRDAHLPAGVAHADVAGGAADAAGGRRGADRRDDRPGLLGQSQVVTEVGKPIVAEHRGALHSTES